MRLTRSVTYAVSILLKVESEGMGAPMTAAQIARGAKFPPRFLYRILRRLVDAGLLTGVSGPGGGYALARRARQVSLRDIVSAVEGPESPQALRPVVRQHTEAIQMINSLVERANAAFQRQLAATSLEKLAKSKPAEKSRARAKRPAR